MQLNAYNFFSVLIKYNFRGERGYMRPKRTKQSGVANAGVGRGADCPLGHKKTGKGRKKLGMEKKGKERKKGKDRIEKGRDRDRKKRKKEEKQEKRKTKQGK